MPRFDQSAIDASLAEEEIRSLIESARNLGVPLPRSRKALARVLAAGLREMERTGELPPPEFLAAEAKRRTPAQTAASLANLDKARLAPKEKIYQMTPKRRAAYRANGAKGNEARRRKLAQMVDGLDQAFPPLREEAEPPPEAERASVPQNGPRQRASNRPMLNGKRRRQATSGKRENRSQIQHRPASPGILPPHGAGRKSAKTIMLAYPKSLACLPRIPNPKGQRPSRGTPGAGGLTGRGFRGRAVRRLTSQRW